MARHVSPHGAAWSEGWVGGGIDSLAGKLLGTRQGQAATGHELGPQGCSGSSFRSAHGVAWLEASSFFGEGGAEGVGGLGPGFFLVRHLWEELGLDECFREKRGEGARVSASPSRRWFLGLTVFCAREGKHALARVPGDRLCGGSSRGTGPAGWETGCAGSGGREVSWAGVSGLG